MQIVRERLDVGWQEKKITLSMNPELLSVGGRLVGKGLARLAE